MTIEGGRMTDTEDYIVFDRTGTPHVVVAVNTEQTLRDAIARLPDPDTGLVNCGCGGTNHAHYYVNSPGWWGIKCNKCGLAVNGYETREEAVRAANIALGYKGASK